MVYIRIADDVQSSDTKSHYQGLSLMRDMKQGYDIGLQSVFWVLRWWANSNILIPHLTAVLALASGVAEWERVLVN